MGFSSNRADDGRDVIGYQPRTTVRLPPPDRVAAYLRHRATITARWADCDALWDAMTEGEHDDCVAGLGKGWRPRR